MRCEDKVGYDTETQCVKALLRASKRAGPLRYYKCPICNKWHLTHKALDRTNLSEYYDQCQDFDNGEILENEKNKKERKNKNGTD